MKAYTDILQSKKLEEILPLKSADMHYATWTIVSEDGEFIVSVSQQGETIEELQKEYGNQIIPCWSLAALLDVMSNPSLHRVPTGWGCSCHDKDYNLLSMCYGKTPIDACYEVILKLHKQKVL